MVAGTGVTTAMQLLSNVLEGGPLTDETPKLTVMYAAPTMDSLELVPELTTLAQQYPEHVSLGLWVEAPPPRLAGTLHGMLMPPVDTTVTATDAPRSLWQQIWTSRTPEHYSLTVREARVPVAVGRMAVADVATWIGRTGADRLVFVCGPNGFISAVAGPKDRDMVSQGPLGGMLAELGLRAEEVVKL